MRKTRPEKYRALVELHLRAQIEPVQHECRHDHKTKLQAWKCGEKFAARQKRAWCDYQGQPIWNVNLYIKPVNGQKEMKQYGNGTHAIGEKKLV